jgi:hypothetical protein
VSPCVRLGSVIYNIWHTRNEIKHLGQPSSGEQILKKVFWKVRTRIAGNGNLKLEGI